MPKVSVVIPVYNVGRYLRGTLDSVLSQTLRDIEIVCADDGSSDDSPAILREYADKDPRIRALFHAQNKGTSLTRKDAVAVTAGDYVMFLDGDDTYTPDACEKAYAAITQHQTDMVQFGFHGIDCSASSAHPMTASQIQALEKWMTPCTERIDGNLVKACWEDVRFRYNITNKIFRGSICRKAFSLLEDERFTQGEDLYSFFVIATLSHSYIGINDRLYCYYYGRGTFASYPISLEQYDDFLSGRRILDALERYAVSLPEPGAVRPALESIRLTYLNDGIYRWMRALSTEDMTEGFRRLSDTWGYGEVIAQMAAGHWTDLPDVAEAFLQADTLRHTRRPPCSPSGRPLTIAAHYFRIHGGGGEKVTAQLCNIWANQKDETGRPRYRVLLLTDEEEPAEAPAQPEEDYPLSPLVERACLPSGKTCTQADYRRRMDVWNSILSEYKVDMVVSGRYADTCTLWDLLTVKGHPRHPAFVLLFHNYTILPYRWGGKMALALSRIYRLCDGVTVLSECDETFVRSFTPHVQYIPNPVPSPDLTGSAGQGVNADHAGPADPVGSVGSAVHTSSHEPHTILWTGRIAREKNPMDLVLMMERVVRDIPEARLILVGQGEEALMEQLQERIRILGLENNIELAGFVDDVDMYYRQASVFVMTSAYEGFPLSLAEALSWGVPAVIYDLPWLTFVRDGRGIRTVPQGSFGRMAAEVVSLLSAPDRIRQLGADGQSMIRGLSAVDLGKKWDAFFQEIWNRDNDASRAASVRESDRTGISIDIASDTMDEAIVSAIDDTINDTDSGTDRMGADISILFRSLTEYQEIAKNEVRQQGRERLDGAWAECRRVNERLQQSFADNHILREKLQTAWSGNRQRGEEIQRLKEENARLRRETQSLSCRIGRGITWIPRKLRTMFRRGHR